MYISRIITILTALTEDSRRMNFIDENKDNCRQIINNSDGHNRNNFYNVPISKHLKTDII